MCKRDAGILGRGKLRNPMQRNQLGRHGTFRRNADLATGADSTLHRCNTLSTNWAVILLIRGGFAG